MSRKVLICDGEWNLKRNFKKRTELFSRRGEHAGGTFGFLETLGIVINKVLPDRVVVMWDGDMSGKLRHDFYPLYKHDHKSWDEETYFRTQESLDAEARMRVSCTNQKIKVKNFLESLFIRQVEVDYIEGDDLIAQYILTKPEDESVIIYSRDKDYYQLISEDVYVLRPADNIIVTPSNFKKLFGYTHLNSLMVKCFEGDSSDNVSGVPGIALKTLLKYFPRFADEPYTIDRIISEAYDLYGKKKLKTLENILGSRKIYERNNILMNLHQPLLNKEAIEQVNIIQNCVLAHEDGYVDRSVLDVIKEVRNEGYDRWMINNNVDAFFAPYHRIALKEKQYTKSVLEG